MVIGVDIDSTIQDREAFLDTVGVAYFGKVRVQGRCFDTDRFDVSLEEYEEFWREYTIKYQLDGKCYKGVSKKINDWMMQGHKIVILTARATGWLGVNPELEVANTELWLKKNNIPYDCLVFSSDKGGIVKSMGIDVMLEDSPGQIRKILGKNPDTTIWMKSQYYNQGFYYNEMCNCGVLYMFEDFREVSVC